MYILSLIKRTQNNSAYLEDFINVACHLTIDIIKQKNNYNIVGYIICDASDRTLVKMNKGHTGYYSIMWIMWN